MTGIIIISATIGALVGAMAMLLAGNRTKMRLLRDNEQLKANLQNANRQNTELQSAHKTELRRLEETQQRQLEQQMALIKEQMNSASELILQHRQQQLEQTNIRQMGLIVEPLKMELKRMQEVVDKASLEHSSSMVRLDSAIKTNLMQAKEVGDKADRLAQALTGESKTQGDFGELKLKQMLDEMGFEEGLQYEQQTTMRDRSGHTVIDQGGHRLQPDVILHFPENRDIIIDSKVSLTAFKDYCDSTTDEQRKEMLNRHVASMRRHIDELSHKDYSRHLNGGKVDFVVMYVFSDKALQLAAAAEPHLYRDAYDKRVIICGSNNLYGLLRVLESSWRQMKQVENQQHFVEAANSIIERVQIFAERFRKVEDTFANAQRALEEVKRVSADSGQSIIVAANKLVKYGASQSKRHKALPPQAPE